VLAFKLLRYLNSPAFGLSQPVLTIDKAVMVLGRERCYRWVSLLLFDIQQSGYRERVLIEHALTRAFYLESLAGQGLLQGPKEELFILGLFSMLDLLIGHPLETILQETHLPAPVHHALLGQGEPTATPCCWRRPWKSSNSTPCRRWPNGCSSMPCPC